MSTKLYINNLSAQSLSVDQLLATNSNFVRLSGDNDISGNITLSGDISILTGDVNAFGNVNAIKINVGLSEENRILIDNAIAVGGYNTIGSNYLSILTTYDEKSPFELHDESGAVISSISNVISVDDFGGLDALLTADASEIQLSNVGSIGTSIYNGKYHEKPFLFSYVRGNNNKGLKYPIKRVIKDNGLKLIELDRSDIELLIGSNIHQNSRMFIVGQPELGLNVNTAANGDAAVGYGNVVQQDMAFSNGQSNIACGRQAFTSGKHAVAAGFCAAAIGEEVAALGHEGIALGRSAMALDDYSFCWSSNIGANNTYVSHGNGTFNINTKDGANGFYIGDQTLNDIIGQNSINNVIDYIDEISNTGTWLKVKTNVPNFILSFNKIEKVNGTKNKIDWGDGTISADVSGSNISHTYAIPSEYVIRFTNTLKSISFNTYASGGIAYPNISAIIDGNIKHNSYSNIQQPNTVWTYAYLSGISDFTFLTATNDSRTEIYQGEFRECGIDSMKYFFGAQDKIKKFGNGCFSMCKNLSDTDFLKQFTALSTIESNAFNGCTSISCLDFQSSDIKQVYNTSTFANCPSLTSIIFRGNTSVPNIISATSYFTLFDKSPNLSVFVPDNLFDQWRQAEYWNTPKILSVIHSLSELPK